MAQNNTLGMNRTFPIYNADDTAFHDLELKKSTVESVVMSLGDKVTGDVFYKDNTLAVTMQEYIIVDDVKYMLVSPPTIVREGMVSDNTQLKGMTKYSFTFYHPMYMLGNFPFTDIAVTQDEEKYLSQNKTFSWIGNLFDFRDKLNANLASTEWLVVIDIPQYEQDGVTETQQWKKANELSDVLSFDKQFISDALKAGYDTWKIPFVITPNTQVVNGVTKKFKIEFGLPSQEIYTIDAQGERTSTPFIFQFGKGVGLKNNSRTPRNNKIVTRIVGCGSERNVPFGYPQIIWSGDARWEYTAYVNNDPDIGDDDKPHGTPADGAYPLYMGIVGGQNVKLIKHPFTRSTLMPSVYFDTVNKKVNPNATGYNPNIEIKDYYDAIDDETREYPNNINLLSPSVELHQFEDIYPRLINQTLVSVSPYDGEIELISKTVYNTRIQTFKNQSANYNEKSALQDAYDKLALVDSITHTGGSYTYEYKRLKTQAYQYGTWYHVKYTSGNINYEYYVWDGTQAPQIDIVWDDTMNDDGEYVQSYFKMKLPVLNFDLYASAAVTQEMKINMRSGDCLGCTFPVQVDWDDYKANFYDADGNFDPVIGSGHPRNGDKYPDSSQGQITIVVQKDNETFGTLMPNIYQQPASGDKFVILGISLPTSYITDAEAELDDAMKEYMLENNVHYYDYPLKFDEYFLVTNTGILEQIQNNNIVRFQYGSELPKALYIKQITIKYGEKPLPQYDITLTDDIEIVLNQIGQVTDDVSRMRVQVSELQKYYSENIMQAINEKLSKVVDDVCQGRITFQQGLDAIGSVIFHDEVRSPQFESGLYTGRGWRIDNLGNAEFESIRIRSYLEVVELLVNRLQAQEGDTLFTDNDQIDRVDRIVDETDGSISYVLSLKEKYQGYITGQMYGNVVKGIINTLAAKQAGVSDVQDSQTVEIDGSNTYYTSWMQVIATHNTNNPDNSLGVNQIKVVLYGDDYYDEGHEGEPDHLHHITPAGKNFEPCELMTIARWGCVDYSDPEDQDYESIKASIIRRQRMFMISTTEGRVVKYTGVDSPILRNGNYGVTIGELPEFVKNYPDVRAILNQVGEHTDWLYAQGVVVGKFIKVDIEGNPEPNIIDCGNWVNGANVVSPTPRNGVYLYNEWNSQTQQYETHDVWHNNAKWRCKMTQPVVSGGVAHYYEPTDANSAYWQKLASGGQDGKDGNSVIIAGYADYYHDKDYLGDDMPAQVSETEVGQINLKAYTDPDEDMIDVGEEGYSSWQSYGVPVGTCYILRGNYHLYEATENDWLDLGRFKGEDGAKGGNTATVYLYKRSASAITSVGISEMLYYKFSTKKLYTNSACTTEATTQLNGWSLTIPSGTDPIYVTAAIAYSNDVKDGIAWNEWVTPSQFTENGEDGAHGINTASIFLYKRASSEPNDSNSNYKCPQRTLYYKFTDGELYKLSGSTYTKVVDGDEYLSGWSRQIPTTNGHPCYVIQAAALGNEDYDAIEVTKSGSTYTKKDWSDVSKLVEDGEDGTSPFIADLDNEMDSVACDAGGHPASSQEVSTKVSLYKGSTPIAINSIAVKDASGSTEVSMTSGSPLNGVTPTFTAAPNSDTAQTISFSFATGSGTSFVNDKRVFRIIIGNSTENVSRNLYFTVNGVRPGADGEAAVLYNLLPSVNAISFGEGSLAQTVYMELLKTEGESSSTISMNYPPNDIEVHYSTNTVPDESNPQTQWGTVEQGVRGISFGGTANNTATIQPNVEFNKIYLALFKTAGSGDNKTYTLIDRETIPIVKDGKNAFVVDLENEMDSVACDANGEATSLTRLYTKVSAFYGAQEKTSECTIRLISNDTGGQVRLVNSNSSTASGTVITSATSMNDAQYIRVQFASGDNVEQHGTVVLEIVHATYGTRQIYFTINGVRGGADGLDAILQELLPSLDAISFARTAAGGLTPPSRDLTLSIKKTQGGQTTEQNISGSGLTIKWSVASMPSTSSHGTDWGQNPNPAPTGITWNNGVMQIASNVSATNIYIAAFNSSGTLVDRETIPIIKDGNNGSDGDDGQDALNLVLDTYSIAFPTNSDYEVENELRYTVGVKMFLGNNTQQTITNINATSSDGDVYVYVNETTDGINIYIGEATFQSTITISVTASCSLGTRTAEIYLTAVPMGAVGSRGKIGRFFYYAQEWYSTSSISYVVSDAEAPYFSYNNQYWVFNPEQNYPNGISMDEMGAPSSSSSNWQIMTNDFKYIITEAIFGNYAHFGSFIINGDWMISQHGKVNGETTNSNATISGTTIASTGNTSFTVKAYTIFDNESPTGESDLLARGANESISSSASSSTLASSVPLNDIYTYCVKCKGHRNSSNYTVYLRIRNSNPNCSWQAITLPTGSDSELSVNFRVAQSSANYVVDLYQPTTGGGASVTEWSISRIKFAPNFAVDGLTGKTYQNDAYIKGVVEAVDGIFNGELTAGDMKVTRRQESDHVWSGMYTPSLSEAVSIGVRNYDNNSYSGEIILLGSGFAGGYVYTYAGGNETGSKFELSYARPTVGNRSRIVLASGNESGKASITVQTTVESGASASATVIEQDKVTTPTVEATTARATDVYASNIRASAGYRIPTTDPSLKTISSTATINDSACQMIIVTGNSDVTITLTSTPETGKLMIIKKTTNSGWVTVKNSSGTQIGLFNCGSIVCVYNSGWK